MRPVRPPSAWPCRTPAASGSRPGHAPSFGRPPSPVAPKPPDPIVRIRVNNACAARACAPKPRPRVPPPGFVTWGSGECVETADQPTVIEDGLCAPACGVQASDGRIVQCPFGTCICGEDGGECSVADATCPTGTAFVADDRCLSYSATAPAQSLAAGELCPAEPVDRACGVGAPDGRLSRCGAGEACVCDGSAGRCARVEPTCPSERAYVPTNRCAPADGGPVSTVNGVLCPGAPPPPPLVCGTLDSAGRVQGCETGEQCICRPSGGTCAATEPACPFGLSNANDGACVGLSETTFTRPVAADALCPPMSPTPVLCGQMAETECAGDLRCGCSGPNTGVCVLEQAACASGLAEAATLRCIGLTENLQVIDSGACTTGGP